MHQYTFSRQSACRQSLSGGTSFSIGGTILLLLSTLSLSAQESLRPWQLYLADGNFLRATHIDTLPDGQLAVYNLGSEDAIMLSPQLVERAKRSPRGSLLGPKGRTVQAEGWYLEGGLMWTAAEVAGPAQYLRHSLSFQFGGGYHYRPWLSVGAGLGIDWYDQVILPVFLQARAYLPKYTTAPYVQLQAGYGLPAQDLFDRDEFQRTYGGLFWHPAIGIRLATKRHADWHVDLGYRFQRVRREFNAPDDGWWWPSAETQRIRYRSFVLRLSTTF